MKLSTNYYSIVTFCVTLLLMSTISSAEEFSSPAVDLGIVVADLDKSVKFYTEAIGLKDAGGFTVPGEFAGKAGLSDSKTLNIKSLSVGEGPSASKIKLMQFEGSDAKSENKFIHSTLGFSYLTIHVTDTQKAMERLKKAGVKAHKNSPIALPAPLPTHVFITLVRDPDGNFVELVGPKM